MQQIGKLIYNSGMSSDCDDIMKYGISFVVRIIQMMVACEVLRVNQSLTLLNGSGIYDF